MKRIYLLFLCFIASLPVFAVAVNSAELRYEYTGSGNIYKVYLQVVKGCTGGATFNPTENIQFVSTCGNNFTRTFNINPSPLTQFPYYCSSVTTNCTSTTSSNPGYQIAEYSDTVTLDPCSSWKMIYINSVRSGATDNIIVFSGTTLYIEAFLNNSNSPNSSAYCPTPALAIIKMNDTVQYAFQNIDVNGDSLAYEWYQPRTTNNALIPYIGTYTPSSPIDGTVSINLANQTMTIHPTMTGYYTLALKVNDYRNGVMVGSSVRDFTLFVTGSMKQSNPLSVSNNNFFQTTCPGNTNSITYTFNDPNPNDTVSLSVTTPSISGFTFNVTNTPGVGTASTTISWTTPSSYNPATMPYFFFGIQAKDNHCPVMGVSNYVVLVSGTQCITDSVWAGDANGDFSVNNYDPLAIAVAYGSTGTARPNASTNWQAEACPNWSSSFNTGINFKHADCNGDGLVDTADLNAIYTNYGNWHLKPTPQAKTTNVPDLYFDISGIPFIAGTTVNIPIKLGSATLPMNNIYGVAGKINIGGITLAAAPQLTFNPSWIGTSANTLNFAMSILNNIDWALARINHQNVSGNGTIAMLKIQLPVDAIGQTMTLSFSNTKIVNNQLQANAAFNESDTSVTISTMSVDGINPDIESAFIFPNPTQTDANLHLILKASIPLTVQVMDISGKIIKNINAQATNGKNSISLSANGLSSGVYFVKVISENASFNLKWIKE